MDRSDTVAEVPIQVPETAPAPLGVHIPVPPWSLYSLVVILCAGYLIFPLLTVNVLHLTSPFMNELERFTWGQSTTVLSWIVIFGGMQWYYHADMLKLLGLRLERPPSYYLWQGILAFIALAAMILLYSLAAKFMGIAPQKPTDNLPFGEKRIMVFFAVMMAPVLEEVIFRGMVQPTFLRYFKPAGAVIVTCLLFMIFHGNYWQYPFLLIYVFLTGLLLGHWRQRTGSVLPGIFAHFCNNLLASFLMGMR